MKKTNDLETLRFLTLKLKGTKDPQVYASLSYSVWTVFILSTEIFNQNKELKPILDKLEIKYKDYVYKNRTDIMGRTNRFIKTASTNKLKEINEFIYDFAFKQAESKNETINYYDDLLEQFGNRNEK